MVEVWSSSAILPTGSKPRAATQRMVARSEIRSIRSRHRLCAGFVVAFARQQGASPKVGIDLQRAQDMQSGLVFLP